MSLLTADPESTREESKHESTTFNVCETIWPASQMHEVSTKQTSTTPNTEYEDVFDYVGSHVPTAVSSIYLHSYYIFALV